VNDLARVLRSVLEAALVEYLTIPQLRSRGSMRRPLSSSDALLPKEDPR
jgi:hypothetical protein